MFSIGANNLQFYPSFALFSRLNEARPPFFSREPNQVTTKKKSPKVSEDQKKKKLLQKLKSFCPRNSVKAKKNKKNTGLHQNLKSFCPRNLVNGYKKSPKIIQHSDADHSQIFFGGVYPPIPPGFRQPRLQNLNRPKT